MPPPEKPPPTEKPLPPEPPGVEAMTPETLVEKPRTLSAKATGAKGCVPT